MVEDEVIIVAVRWYLTYPLSNRQICELLHDRGIVVAPSTVMRWVLRYAPEFEKRWRRYEKTVGLSWRVDETYIKVSGEWTYRIEPSIVTDALLLSSSANGETFMPQRSCFVMLCTNTAIRYQSHWMHTRFSSEGKTGFKRKVPLFRLTLEEGREVDLGLAGKVGNSHIHRVFR